MSGHALENRPVTTGDGRQRILGLDGLRALAVVAVLLFHLRVEIARGGFLGVSLFFTLSGYLITRLLLEEHRATGSIALMPFWGRRLRRLMPGALVTLAAITVVALAFDVFDSPTVRGDLWAALGYVANWRFMSASTSYADLFASAPSPVLHFWSLAIEEQFYFAFPVVLLALLGRRGRRRAALVGLGVLWVASLSASLIGASDNTVYYGLHTRAAELLTGALVALVLADRAVPPGTTLGTRLSNGAVTVALAGFVALVITTDTGDRWLYQGGLAAVSLLSVILVVGVQTPGPWQWLAERRPVVAIGELSYGLYLVHWPVFLILDADRTGLEGVALAGLRLVVTWSVAWSVAAAIERPIRRARILPTAGRRAAALTIGLAVIAGVMFFVPRTPPVSLAGLEAPDEVVDFGDDEPELTIAVLGSQPSAVADLRSVIEGLSVEILDVTDPTCPVTTFAFAREGCDSLGARLDALEIETRPDLVVVGFGPGERELVEPALSLGEGEIFDWVQRYLQGVTTGLGGRESVLLDYGPPDVLAGEIEDVGLGGTTVSSLHAPTLAEITDLYTVLATKIGGADRRQRLMVLGDSSSFGVSAALDAVAGDRFDVVWAGGQNCPLVAVDKVRWWEGVEFDMDYCPTLDGEWRDLLDTFRPDRVVIVVTVPEQAEQRYPGDPDWHIVGDPDYQRVHDEFIEAFMGLVIERDIEVMIFNSPLVHGGALGGAPFARDERVAGWNDVLASWVRRWPRIALVDWAAIIATAEPEPGSLRIDGVHLEQSVLNTIVAREIVPLLGEPPRSVTSTTIG